jgi:hypothetical protein
MSSKDTGDPTLLATHPRLPKIGGRLIRHARYFVLQLAEQLALQARQRLTLNGKGESEPT